MDHIAVSCLPPCHGSSCHAYGVSGQGSVYTAAAAFFFFTGVRVGLHLRYPIVSAGIFPGETLQVESLDRILADRFADLLHFPGSVHHAERQDQKIHGEEKQGEHQGRLHGQTGIESAGSRRRPPDFRLETGQPEWCLESRFRFVFLFSEGDHQHGTADLHIPSPLSCPEDAAGYPPCLPPRYGGGPGLSRL